MSNSSRSAHQLPAPALPGLDLPLPEPPRADLLMLPYAAPADALPGFPAVCHTETAHTIGIVRYAAADRDRGGCWSGADHALTARAIRILSHA